ncbi:subtilisin-like protein, partial [Basidiobolus meristosporus CBS 931.73]
NETITNETPEIPVQSIGSFQWSYGSFKESDLIELRKLPEIAYIEPDVNVTAYDVQKKTPSWGIDRIDQQTGTDGRFHYPASAGENVTIYSIDTGVNIDHEEFEGRATNGPIFNGDSTPDDVNGHGTFVAAVAVGKNFGVAKKARLVSLKALDADGYGSMNNILQAVDWVVQEHKKNPNQKSVVNLSLGAVYSQVANDAVEEAIKLGIHFAIAAGNDSDDACHYSPSSVKSALVVGATTNKDEIASFSNTGSCVSIYAPGQGIKSAWKDSTTSTHSLSGTSMASPHVAGVIALILGEQDLDPYSMQRMIKNQTTI